MVKEKAQLKKVHVKNGDIVLVLSGKDRGKKGKVLRVDPNKGMVLVEGINMSTKHKKPKTRYEQGGILHQESPVNSSKVMLICNRCGEPTKVGKSISNNGDKSRLCKKCDEIIDVLIEKNDNK
ncbi:MAG: 50S ribosomal protein L24 [Clostridia bacterium]|jgi:large subunit ribosomal protein L24